MKNTSISYLRAISMIMIITCHILQGLNNRWAFWINVGVQIFFFISGFLYGKKEIKNISDFYKSRVEKIFVPYIIVLTIGLLLERVFLNKKYSFYSIFGNYLGFGGFCGCIEILTHTWFISYILLCYLLIPVFQKMLAKKLFRNNLYYFMIVCIFIQLLQEFQVLSINSCWINNFLFGYFYSRCCKSRKEKIIFETSITMLFIIVIPFAFIYQENIEIYKTFPNILNSHSGVIIQYGHVLLGSVLFIYLYKLFDNFNMKYNTLLDFFDKYSFYIYLVHQIFILNSFSILYLTDNITINIILIFVLSFLFGMMVKRLNNIVINLFSKNYDKLSN